MVNIFATSVPGQFNGGKNSCFKLFKVLLRNSSHYLIKANHACTAGFYCQCLLKHTSVVFPLYLATDRLRVAERELCSMRLTMPATIKTTLCPGTFEVSLTWY